MNNKIKTILFTLLFLIIGTIAYAYDFEVKNADGVPFYYNYINDGKELEVTYFAYPTVTNHTKNYDYKGSIVIPEEVTYMNRTRKVTKIGYEAFNKCSNMTSIMIPNSVTNIGDYAFEFCSGLTSINIPNSVTKIGTGAFRGCI